MSDTQEAAQGGADHARIVEEHHIAGARGEDEIEAIDDRGRRWHQVRPQPRCRTDLMGFNSTLWMALGWLVVILLVVFPFPWVW
jgi:hypothetical protein